MAQPASPLRVPDHHLHIAAARCPTCDQPVPNDKLNEITARLNTRDQAISNSIHEQLSKNFAAQIAQVQTEAKAELQRVSNDNAGTIERLKQDAAAREAQVRLEAEVALKDQLAEAARQRQAAEEASTALQADLKSLRDSSEATIAHLQQEAGVREGAARAEATEAAEAKLQGQIAEIMQLRETAEQVAADRQRELEELQTKTNATIEELKGEAATRETTARAEAKAEAQASWQSQLDEIVKAKEAAESQATALASSQQERLDEQRAALERAKDDAVNTEKAKAFDEKLKLETQLKDMARQLEKKTADELGEGAEIKLLEDLKERFDGDTFTHVGKGNAGVDIIHEVIHNGKVCGKIVYDSKNRNAWRNEYVSKLRKDQVAAQADHAILSTQTMPAGAKQLHIQDSVIIANPARILILVELLRQQIITAHKLRLSNESKVEKTAALYTFMTSELCSQLFSQIESRAGDIEELDVKEKKTHETVWRRRGELV
ncbi:MAG: DUF2130 domain-containing protein, partial [Bradyrhizobium sp.]